MIYLGAGDDVARPNTLNPSRNGHAMSLVNLKWKLAHAKLLDEVAATLLTSKQFNPKTPIRKIVDFVEYMLDAILEAAKTANTDRVVKVIELGDLLGEEFVGDKVTFTTEKYRNRRDVLGATFGQNMTIYQCNGMSYDALLMTKHLINGLAHEIYHLLQEKYGIEASVHAGAKYVNPRGKDRVEYLTNAAEIQARVMPYIAQYIRDKTQKLDGRADLIQDIWMLLKRDDPEFFHLVLATPLEKEIERIVGEAYEHVVEQMKDGELGNVESAFTSYRDNTPIEWSDWLQVAHVDGNSRKIVCPNGVSFSLQADRDGVYLCNLQSEDKGKGHARDTLMELTATADRVGVAIALDAIAGAGGMRQSALEGFYRRCGFKNVGGSNRMVYRPQQAEQAAVERVLYRGVNAGDEKKPLRASERGRFGAGVYLTEQPGVAGMYGDHVMRLVLKGKLFNAMPGWSSLDPKSEAAIIKQLTKEQQEKLAESKGWYKKDAEAFWESLRRLPGGDNTATKAIQKAGFAGIEGLGDGHEIVVFDPKDVKPVEEKANEMATVSLTDWVFGASPLNRLKAKMEQAKSAEWWEKLSTEEQRQYLENHPGSKLDQITKTTDAPPGEAPVESPSKWLRKGMTIAGADRSQLPSHIKALRIPPGWKELQYNENTDADLLAIGKDAKNRDQYVYSEKFIAANQASKFARIREIDGKFEDMLNQTKSDQEAGGVKGEHALVAELVFATGIRPGSDDDTGAEKKAYGATTLKGSHVKVAEDGSVRLQFTGKKGVDLDLPVNDENLARKLAVRAKEAGDDGNIFPKVNDESLRDYVKTLDGGEFKTKDIRTALGTRLARDAMRKISKPLDAKTYKNAAKEVGKVVSQVLGNTVSVALTSYIDPTLFTEWRASAGV